MKKLITILSSVALFIGVTENSKAQMSFGAKGGLNYDFLTTKYKKDKPSETPENPSGIGFHLGGYMTYMFSEKVGIRPEFVISVRGIKMEESLTYSADFGGVTETYKEEYTYKGNFTYIDIPILLNFAATENLSFQLGPQFGILGGYKAKVESTSTVTYSDGTPTSTLSFSETSTDKTGINSLDLGLAVGGIFELESGLNFGLRYHRTLNSLNSEYTEYYAERWNVLQLSIGYSFGKK